jgi:hypothetical protein
MRQGRAEDHEGERLGLVDRDQVIRCRVDTVKRPLGPRILGQQLADRAVHLMLGHRLGTIIRQAIERGLRREPVSSGLLIEICRALREFVDGFDECRELVPRFGASQA